MGWVGCVGGSWWVTWVGWVGDSWWVGNYLWVGVPPSGWMSPWWVCVHLCMVWVPSSGLVGWVSACGWVSLLCGEHVTV